MRAASVDVVYIFAELSNAASKLSSVLKRFNCVKQLGFVLFTEDWTGDVVIGEDVSKLYHDNILLYLHST